MRLSIAIASHNEGSNLWRTVRSCLETTEGLAPEIVVVDDASTDGSIAELTRRYGADVRVVPIAERRGVAAAKDLAIRSTHGDVVVMIDAHCKPEPGALETLVRDVGAWRGEAVLCPLLASLDAKTWRNRPDRFGYGFRLDLEDFHCDWLAPHEIRPVAGPDGRVYHASPALVGCTLALTRELYERLGGFDAGMLSWGSEDIDFGLKTWLLGHQVLSDHEAVIGHRFRSRPAPYSIPDEHIIFNSLRMARKNFGDRAWDDWFRRAAASPRFTEWEKAVALFEANRESVERQRDELLARRPRDEYWYAHTFGMAWPLTLPGSPYPVPPEAGRQPVMIASKRTKEPPYPATLPERKSRQKPHRTKGPPPPLLPPRKRTKEPPPPPAPRKKTAKTPKKSGKAAPKKSPKS
jgi:glycosyltransferase involved in cell wall biosynthesis